MTPETAIDISKLEMEKEFKEKLRLFLYLAKPLPIPPGAGDSIGYVISYRLEDVKDKALERHPGMSIFFNGESVLIEDILRQVNLENQLIAIDPHRYDKMNVLQFKTSLLMVLDEYTPEKDKETLRRIINRL